MPHIKSETETVIKKILPYLSRRGYDTVKDLDFETASTITDSYSKGFVDILVTLSKKKAAFLIEAKRISKKLTAKDRDQAISYARAKEIINLIATSRGRSPSADSYVDEDEGYAIVLKAGSNISKLGTLILSDSDWIEKSAYDEYLEKAKEEESNLNLVYSGDVLLASTGDGTLGKTCVYDAEYPAIADGHVTIIRVDSTQINPYYLADYLRAGFGAEQVNRLFTGATGLIELTPEQVDSIVLDLPANVDEQIRISQQLRSLEKQYLEKIAEAQDFLEQAGKVMQ